MGFISETKTETENRKTEFNAEVINARLVPAGGKVTKPFVSFAMKLNGVSIYGCTLREYNKDGKEGYVVGFPSRLGSNGKYYSHAWAPLSKELTQAIAMQCEKLLTEENAGDGNEEPVEESELPFAD